MDITQAESEIMRILWRESPLTAGDILAALGKARDWQPGTVKALINRLLKKGAISYRKDGRRYLYAPKVSRAQYLTGESKSLLDRLFDGRLAPLVAHFSEQRKLGRKDLAELKRLIAEIDDER